MKTLRILWTLSLFSGIFLVSCSKKNSDPPPAPVPPVVLPDTLSTGWTKTILNADFSNNDVMFSNNQTGYLGGTKGFYKTVNGGVTWDSLSNVWFFNLAVTSNGNVYCTQQNNILKSIDGGKSFTTFLLQEPSSDIFFTGNDTGYASSLLGKVFRTTNQGDNWQVLTTLSPFGDTYTTLYFLNDQYGWAAFGSSIYKTNGNSANWKKCNITTTGTVMSIFAITPTIIFAGCNNGEVFKSTDGGENFALVKNFGGSYFTDIHFVNEQTGYLSHGTKIYKTTDGGNSWIPVVALGQGMFIEIHFTDATHGWACGDKGLAMRYSG